ncbi:MULTISPECIES: cellulose binding domain-containing protein [Streptomycetaceae]|uniref:chitinase n=1 Tax=Streptantibioticus cattleyicolor (strain ATCC 35852 / DSM 46488 / JCM 4925 / NBRC 14057 / NRRL 8057) TaxID=1003195 RepID=F8JT81_STREN|nr:MULTISPECIES: cellulose binding domain-containing protein [Streptomycetaceae]AEW94231.1 sugar hydrolase [Streptantibioticus cattleyicolor NRRL 8057 = DSM 46488]MYS58889.1 sugar hydrolase [Streptomyces sp. SID5468]CCB74584.1 putative sugar hydrolase, secreted [Streptantibioticus cattleyicolor NRRL 8057 = DSM 46488]
MSSSHRRRPSRRVKLIGGLVTAAAVAGTAVALAGSAQAAPVGAAYSRTSGWSGGYTGQYVISNSTGQALTGWTLSFRLPAGSRISSLWNGTYTVDGDQVTVKPADWNATVAPGGSVTVGFVVTGAADPAGCLIDGATCSVDSGPAPTPSGRPTTAPPTPTASPTGPAPTPTSGTGTGTAATAGFSPYVDTSLYPPYDLVAQAKATGVKQYNLAFVTSGGGCVPKWGGVTDLGADAVAARIGDLRAAGGDVRVSFGGANGTELAAACSSASDLAAAYGKVIDAYRLTKVDFDVEGGALADTAANTRRAQAIARLQHDHPGLEVSYTLPVMPTGLTQDGVDLLTDAKAQGVDVAAVNVMAMDYGASYSGDMGRYAIDAATATQAQVKSVLGVTDTAAWKKVAVTPMIGVNDVAAETFTVADAAELASFAKSKGLAWLSMWSATRDKQCAGGAKNYADATCSSITQNPGDFAKAFAAYGG